MRGIILRILINALGLWLAAALIDGVDVRSTGTLFLAAICLGLVNALIRPLVVLLTLPVTLLSLGGFLLVINAGMLALVGWLVDGVHVAGFFPALFGALVVSITAWLTAAFIGPNGRYEVLVIRPRR